MLRAVRPVLVCECVVAGQTILLVHHLPYHRFRSTALGARLFAFENFRHFCVSCKIEDNKIGKSLGDRHL